MCEWNPDCPNMSNVAKPLNASLGLGERLASLLMPICIDVFIFVFIIRHAFRSIQQVTEYWAVLISYAVLLNMSYDVDKS